MNHILIVDDCFDSAASLKELIFCLAKDANISTSISTAHSLRDAKRQLALQSARLIFLDLKLPDGNGIDIISDRDACGGADVVLMTGYASIETAIDALRLGAIDYLIKPVDINKVDELLRKCLPSIHVESSNTSDGTGQLDKVLGLIGGSAAMQDVYRQVMRVAQTSVSVFITGESGSGKEVVAQTLHNLSKRKDAPFLAVNCGAISPNLIESEVFGHEKGSFTGAEKQHQGFFERAEGGTLFLDEVTEMPLELQVKLLRVLETGQFMRVGSTTTRDADVRIIAASNRCVHQAVLDGKLREDLLYRLNVFPIQLPPLRERLVDVPALAEYFLHHISEQEGKKKSFLPQALQRLCCYSWPGNVRELRNSIQRAYVMEEGETISCEWLPPTEDMERKQESVAAAGADLTPPSQGLLNENSGECGASSFQMSVGLSVGEAERMLIEATLKECNFHKEKAAAILGISLKTLYNRIKEYEGASRPESSERSGSVVPRS